MSPLFLLCSNTCETTIRKTRKISRRFSQFWETTPTPCRTAALQHGFFSTVSGMYFAALFHETKTATRSWRCTHEYQRRRGI
jgi:hypothetical protein